MDLLDKFSSGCVDLFPSCLVDFITFYDGFNGLIVSRPCKKYFPFSGIKVITLLDGFIGQKYVRKLALVSFCNQFIVAGTRTKLMMHSQNTQIKAKTSKARISKTNPNSQKFKDNTQI